MPEFPAGALTNVGKLPFVLLQPSGDATGAQDNANFVAAQNTLPIGGVIAFAPGIFYTNTQWAVNVDTSQNATQNHKGNPVCLQGSPSTIICGVGAFTSGVISYHRATSYGAQYNAPADPTAGFVRDLVIDGTYATGASVGLDVGDGRGIAVDVTCQNFDLSGQVGLQVINRTFWTEKGWFRAQLYNNTIAARLATNIPATDHSNEYNEYDFTLFANQNQQGIVVDGTNQGGCNLKLKGNMCQTTATSGAPTGNVAALSLIKTQGTSPESRWYGGSINMKLEFNQTAQFPTGTVAPYGIYSDGTGYVRETIGNILHSLTNSNLNGAEFTFQGLISGDPNLAQGWPSTAFPGYGNAWNNKGPAANVCITGGTVTSIVINGVTTGLTSGAFYVAANGTITVNGSGGAPTFHVAPASQGA